jgi:hypothetical protein
VKRGGKQSHAGFSLGLFFDLEDGGDMFPPKHLLTFNGLHGVTFRKIVVFVNIAVRASKCCLILMKLLKISAISAQTRFTSPNNENAL